MLGNNGVTGVNLQHFVADGRRSGNVMTVSEFARQLQVPRSFVYDGINRGAISVRNGILVYVNGRPHISMARFVELYGRNKRHARGRKVNHAHDHD